MQGGMKIDEERIPAESRKAPRTVPDRVLGWSGGALIVAAIYVLVASATGGGGSAAAEIPALELISPGDNEEVSLPMEIRFRTENSLSVQPGGWGSGGYHLHAELSGREVMPGPEDIRRRPDGSYAWTLAGVQRGAISLRLFWSDAMHRPVLEGSSRAARITIR